MGVVLRQAWSESQWTALMRYLTISTNVRRYQTHHRRQLFLSERRRTGALCVTQSNWVKMWFSCFPVLPGSAEAQVTWGGTVKRLLVAIAYFIVNISAKKVSKSIHVCHSYGKPKAGTFFETRCIVLLHWGFLSWGACTHRGQMRCFVRVCPLANEPKNINNPNFRKWPPLTNC